MALLITADKKLWSASSFDLHRHFEFKGSTSELFDFAVRNMGAAMLVERDGALRIRVRPDFLPETTFETLVELLAKYEPKRFWIDPAMPGHNLVELLTDVSDVVARLQHLRGDETFWSSGVRFNASPWHIDQLRAANRPTLSHALSVWRRNHGVISNATLSNLLKAPIGAKWLLSRLDKNNTPITETLPSYINFWHNHNLSSLIGKPMTDSPDREYAERAAVGYGVTHVTRQPLLEVIDALVTPPGGVQTQLRYDRLLLPWTTKDGSRFVTSTSFTRVERPPTPTFLSSAKIA